MLGAPLIVFVIISSSYALLFAIINLLEHKKMRQARHDDE